MEEPTRAPEPPAATPEFSRDMHGHGEKTLESMISPPPSDPYSRARAKVLQIVQGTIQKIKRLANKEKWQHTIENFEPMAVAEWATHAVQRQKSGSLGTAITVVLSTYFLADLTSLMVGGLIPEPPTNRSVRSSTSGHRMRTADDYNVIYARNLFNSKGIIPGESAPTQENTQQPAPDLNGPPVKTTLPINLIGTMILQNELRSIATIEDKSANAVYPVRVDDEIPGKLRVTHVEPTRVVFINLTSNRPEYAELPEESGTNPKVVVGGSVPKGAGGPSIEKVSSTQYAIDRKEVDRTLSDLNNVLTQARAVPNFENGAPAGYKLFQIVPGSIYDKLGLQNGDVISGLNGTPINDPGKAFEMLSELKTASHLELQVKKDGRLQTFSYDIH